MLPIAPKEELIRAMPDGAKEVVFAADQPQYEPLPAVRIPDGRVVTQWRPSKSELALLYKGEPITIVVHTFNTPLQPISVLVGPIGE
jgi:hypothetical protein